jgi:phosphate transport system ATP-binding protein
MSEVHEDQGSMTSTAVTATPKMRLVDTTVLFNGKAAVKNVSFDVVANQVTALIGPSGSGKTTLLRSMNRLHELTKNATVTGRVELDGQNIYGNEIPMTVLRSRIGMVFQRPNPFPTMTVAENVVAGLRFIGITDKSFLTDAVERSLTAAALWDAVKDRLNAPASTLSGGEQQRLCVARALAVEPEVILMDEPTASLDPISTQQIEDLMSSLKQFTTVVIVTHNMQQAKRISDNTAFLLMDDDRAGQLIEFDTTEKIFTNPKDPRTIDYIAGRFG